MNGVESFFPNTIVNHLQSPGTGTGTLVLTCIAEWEHLLNKVGDSVMIYLLLHTFMFIQLPNNCFLQVSGIPVYKYAKRKLQRTRLYSKRHRLLALQHHISLRQLHKQLKKKKREEECRELMEPVLLTQSDFYREGSAVDAKSDEIQHSRQPGKKNNKKKRLSIWRRRKQQKAAAVLAASQLYVHSTCREF
jgi:hypothetical protein